MNNAQLTAELHSAAVNLLTPQMALASVAELLQEAPRRHTQPNVENLAALLGVLSSHLEHAVARVCSSADALRE